VTFDLRWKDEEMKSVIQGMNEFAYKPELNEVSASTEFNWLSLSLSPCQQGDISLLPVHKETHSTSSCLQSIYLISPCNLMH
jgi:hypothetical protein